MTYEIRYIAGGREKLICFSDREETPELWLRRRRRAACTGWCSRRRRR